MLTRVAIIGAGGRMGSWFARYLDSDARTISLYDNNSGSIKPSTSSRIAISLADCVKDADLVLVCVPVSKTPRIIRDCARHMKSGAILADISSVKRETFVALSKIRSDLKPLCLHPMFGPGATDKKRLKILVVPVRDASGELRIARLLFKDSIVVPLPTPKVHDNAIAIVLGLTYFMNLVFSHFLTTKELKLLKEISGTTFQLQSMLAESIMTDDVELISALVRDNPYALKHITRYIQQASEMSKFVVSKERGKLEKRLRARKASMLASADLSLSYNRLYAAIRAIEG